MFSLTEFSIDNLNETGVLPKMLEQERKQGQKIIAQNLLNMGMSVEDIAQATELPVESIRALA